MWMNRRELARFYTDFFLKLRYLLVMYVKLGKDGITDDFGKIIGFQTDLSGQIFFNAAISSL
jgi:hypothetical protein